MNGLSMAMSKSCCPVYNIGTSSKINAGSNNKVNSFGATNKINLNQGRFQNLPHLRINPHVAIAPILKHRAYSCKNVAGSIFKAPEVRGSVVPPYGLLSFLGITGLVLPKAGVLNSDLFYPCVFLGSGAVFVARRFLWNIMCGFAVLRDKPFSIGDLIQVEDLQGQDLKGQVIGMGPITTSLVTSENRRIQVPTCWFFRKVIVNKSQATQIVTLSLLWSEVTVKAPWAPLHEMAAKIYLESDMEPNVMDVIDEINDVLESNSNVYMEEEEKQPYAALSELPLSQPTSHWELDIVCYLKHMSEDELHLAKRDVLLQTLERVKKLGVKGGGHMVEVKSL